MQGMALPLRRRRGCRRQPAMQRRKKTGATRTPRIRAGGTAVLGCTRTRRSLPRGAAAATKVELLHWHTREKLQRIPWPHVERVRTGTCGWPYVLPRTPEASSGDMTRHAGVGTPPVLGAPSDWRTSTCALAVRLASERRAQRSTGPGAFRHPCHEPTGGIGRGRGGCRRPARGVRRRNLPPSARRRRRKRIGRKPTRRRRKTAGRSQQRQGWTHAGKIRVTHTRT